MKTKVTLTINKDILPKVKSYAKSHGSSLSQLVEDSLIEMSNEKELAFSERWRGKFEKSNKRTSRYKALAKRYF